MISIFWNGDVDYQIGYWDKGKLDGYGQRVKPNKAYEEGLYVKGDYQPGANVQEWFDQ